MTLVERAIHTLSPLLGRRFSERLRNNLPSRKPQLWERFPRALLSRANIRKWKLSSRTEHSNPIIRLPHFDVRMQLSLRSKATDLALYQYGIYEVSGTKLVENVLRPGMTFIDVGANAGYYTLIAARLVGSAGHVYSFEPIKGIVERLRHNIELNGFRNVTIEEGALARCPGRASIYRSAVAENDGLASLLPGPARMPDPEQVVLTTLDEVSGRLPGRLVHLIKIDVEGTEGEVLAGGRETLARDSGPLLLFESFSVGAIAEELAHFGYDVRRVHYSLGGGLEFPRIDERFDDLYATYEPPEFVALKAAWQFGSFDEISYRSRRRIPKLLRILSSLA